MYSPLEVELNAGMKLESALRFIDTVNSGEFQDIAAEGGTLLWNEDGTQIAFNKLSHIERDELCQGILNNAVEQSKDLTKLHHCTMKIADARLQCADKNGRVATNWLEQLN